jgi:hypothetical protein
MSGLLRPVGAGGVPEQHRSDSLSAAFCNLDREAGPQKGGIEGTLFDAKQRQADFPQLDRFTPALRHFSIFLPIAINNIRMAPQQALLTISNVDDIEGYVAEHEEARGKKYVEAIDLPASDARR